jgi:hypothetical protein
LINPPAAIISSCKSITVTANHDQSREGNDRRELQHVIRHHSRSDSLQFRSPFVRPHFRSQQPQTHLRQTMVQMHQHHVIATSRYRLVKRNRTNVLRVRMLKPLCAGRPAAFERRGSV